MSRFGLSPFGRFFVAMLLLDWLLVLPLFVFLPPGTLRTALGAVALLVVVPLGAYWLTYRGGFARLRGR